MASEFRSRVCASIAFLTLLGLWPCEARSAASEVFPPVEGPDTLSIEQCVSRARVRAPDVVESAARVASASLQSESIARNGRGTMRLFGDALVAPKGFYDPALTNLGQYELKVGLDWPLWDGGARLRSRLRAANDASIAEAILDQARRDAGQRAAELAIELLRLSEREQVESAGMEWLDGLLRLIRPAVASGGRSAGDVLRVELERDGLEAALRGTRLDQGAAQRELVQLLDLPGVSPPAIRPPDPRGEVRPSEAESLAALQAIPSSPEVRTSRLAKAQLELELEDLRSQKKFQVHASVDAGLGGTDLTAAVPPDIRSVNPGANFIDRLHRDLGASVRIEFSKTISDPTISLAELSRRQGLVGAELHAQAEERNRTRLIRDLWSRRRSAFERRRALEDIVARSGENLLRSKSLYAAGSLLLLELLDARRLAEDAREREADARAEELKSYKALEAWK